MCDHCLRCHHQFSIVMIKQGSLETPRAHGDTLARGLTLLQAGVAVGAQGAGLAPPRAAKSNPSGRARVCAARVLPAGAGAGTPTAAAPTHTQARFRALLAPCCGCWVTAGGRSLRSGPRLGGEGDRGPHVALGVWLQGALAMLLCRGVTAVPIVPRACSCAGCCMGGGLTGLGLCPQSAPCPPDPASWRHRTGEPGPGPLAGRQCPRIYQT